MTQCVVAGADRVDAGKTMFATGLLARVGGLRVKARAGTDLWFDHDAVRAALSAGRLHGSDAARLVDAGTGVDDVEAINPLHRLWRPANRGDPFIGGADRQFVLDRAGDGRIVNANASVPEPVVEALPLGDARRVSTVDELDRALEELAVPALTSLAERTREADTVVVRSYGDVARPLDDPAVDRVAVIEPGRARVYDGERYAAACDVAGRSPRDGRLEERVVDVIELLEPEADVDLPPLESDARADSELVATAYAPAFGALAADAA